MSIPTEDQETGAPLVPIEEYRARILGAVQRLPAVDLPLREAHGLTLAEEVRAPIDLPPFASSAMDGYAVRAVDVANASPARPAALRIAGRVEMGKRPEAVVGHDEAVAVPTGGMVPDGADAVIPVERCIVEDARVLVSAGVERGRHVRPAGEDLRAGEVLVAAGRRLMAPDLGLLASAGPASVKVVRRARVGIVSTGDELEEPGGPLQDGRVYDANAFTLHGAVVDGGAEPIALGRVGDDAAALLDVVRSGVADVDVVVSSGGVSVGERDPVRGAFDGTEVTFVDVAMQPGKPQAFGMIEGRPFFGLPGNPASVFVSFEVFVRPALMTMMGRPPFRPEVEARLATEIVGPREKTVFARVRVHREAGGWVAAATGGRQSNLLGPVSRANGLAIVPAGAARLGFGDRCRVMLFREPSEP